MGESFLNFISLIDIQSWISIIAIIVSIGSLVFQVCSERSIRTKTERSLLYKEAYKKLLMEDIPLAKNEIKINDSKLTGTNNFIDYLNSMRRKSYFFQEYDKSFCEKIKAYTQDLEDYILKNEEKVFDNEMDLGFENDLDSKLQKIYKLIISKFKI